MTIEEAKDACKTHVDSLFQTRSWWGSYVDEEGDTVYTIHIPITHGTDEAVLSDLQTDLFDMGLPSDFLMSLEVLLIETGA